VRVAEKRDGDWHVNQWLKKAVLLSFGLTENKVIESGHSRFYDKVPMKYADYSEEQFKADGVRVVPDAIVRRGAYVASDVVLMPSYVNMSVSAASWNPYRQVRRLSRTTVLLVQGRKSSRA
jgi:2,3,4,5-tetrahydropyridine-2-carboxylate N-succinyltransferase